MSEKQVQETFEITPEKISGFFREYRDLSNFGSGKVKWEGYVYDSREAAFQASKSTSNTIRERFTKLTPSEAKKQGREIKPLRAHWDEIKDDIMYQICKTAFTDNEDLRTLLLSTGDKYLEETNWWHDSYWGVFQGEGLNKLGHTLMRIRKEMRILSAPAIL